MFLTSVDIPYGSGLFSELFRVYRIFTEKPFTDVTTNPSFSALYLANYTTLIAVVNMICTPRI